MPHHDLRPRAKLSPCDIRLIGVASALGAPDPGCAQAPDVLAAAGLERSLRRRGCAVQWQETLRPAPPADDMTALADVCERLAQCVAQQLDQGRTPVVIGGDHSCAVGTWRGAARALAPRGALGLIWIDAHLDSHTPQTSPSGRAHGMPLAALLGHGDARLTGIAGPWLEPGHVCVVGARSYEPEEAELLSRLGVRVFFAQEVKRRGLGAVLREALAIAAENTAGYGLTLDMDVVDPADAPGVSTPAHDGLSDDELLAGLATLHGDPRLVAVEVVEFNPRLDSAFRTGRLIEDVLAGLLGPGQQQLIALEERWGAHNYAPLPVVLTRGEGAYLWDVTGRRYLDMMSAYSAVSLGHAHPRLVQAITSQARRLAVTSRAYYNDRLPLLLERLCAVTGLDRALPVNTGLEAVETALKAARKWAYKVKGVAQDAAEIIACEGNFHGRSITIVGMSSEAQYRDGFGPFPPGFKRVPYGDARALEQAITPHTAAFLVEPIQGEGGIILPPAGYLARCAEVCRAHNVLLICDEVQTGLGRTGRWLACQHEDVRPDGVILGKALGGGMMPVSAFVARDEVMQVFHPGDHGSTFGGNALGAALALETLAVIEEEGLLERSAALGRELLERLRALRSPLIREVRGRGLFVGVDLEPARVDAHTVAQRLLERGLLTKDTHGTVIRLAPPLVIAREDLLWAVEQIRLVLDKLAARAELAA
jgi:ornithine--oxo-acid transaminase